MLNHGMRARSRAPRASSRPGAPACCERLRDRRSTSRPSCELRIDAELHRAAREAPHLLVRPEDLRLHARHHARDGLVADLGEGLLAEAEEREVGAVPEQQELEVVVPHPEVAFERLLVGVEQIVVRGDAAAGVHVLERLELRQLDASAAPARSLISASIFSLHCA